MKRVIKIDDQIYNGEMLPCDIDNAVSRMCDIAAEDKSKAETFYPAHIEVYYE